MTSTPTGERRKRVEFPYLDGIRGAAALLIVLYHTFLFTGMTGDAEKAMPLWAHLVTRGNLGVPVFIVLSGYVLMLPVVRTPDVWFPRGFRSFVVRRARRILPPYYAAVLFYTLLILIVPAMHDASGTKWDSKIPITWQDFVAHLLMLHDVSPEWIGRIDGPLWSVVVEWQIYFVMPLLLLPLWRLIRPWMVVALFGILTCVLPAFVWNGINYLHPWLLGLFVLGMWAAQTTLGDRPPQFLGPLALASWAAIPLGFVAMHFATKGPSGILEYAVGIPVACTLAWAGRHTMESGRRPAILAPFATKPMLRLGLVSYSVYLFHSPLIGLANILLLPLGLGTVQQYLLLQFIVVPVVLAICVGFFWLVERHFLNSRQRNSEKELRADHIPSRTTTDAGGLRPVTDPLPDR